MNTSDAHVLAPMVRLGTLPLRLLSLERGAALVYTEEIIDAKLANAQRTVDSRLGTVDWRIGSGIILRTCQAEHNKLVVQLGTAEVSTALKAISALKFDPANPLRDGIIGIDINMVVQSTVLRQAGLAALCSLTLREQKASLAPSAKLCQHRYGSRARCDCIITGQKRPSVAAFDSSRLAPQPSPCMDATRRSDRATWRGGRSSRWSQQR